MLKARECLDIKWLVLALALSTSVVSLTHIPDEFMPSLLRERGFDKLLHVLAYGAITVFAILSVRTWLCRRSVLLISCTLLAIGIVDEITQPLAGRQASLADLAADAIGIAAVLLLAIGAKHRLQKIITESASRVCFTAAVGFMAGSLALPVILIAVNLLDGQGLQQQQKEADAFFYRTLHNLFKDSHRCEDGTVSETALETFQRYGPQLGDKCVLFLYGDRYSRIRQGAGYFSGPAFFPSGDMFSVEIGRIDGHFILNKFDPQDWEPIWLEKVHNSEQHSNE